MLHEPRTSELEVTDRFDRRDDCFSPHGVAAKRINDVAVATSIKALKSLVVAEVPADAERDLWPERLGRSLVVKRCFDVVASIFLLAILWPLLLLIAVAIRWDSTGPTLIRQTRNGLNKREFKILKFRTMTVFEEGHTAIQCKSDDPRVTRVGAFLRWTSLDELPQLANVLSGEMSLVGPRPHPVRLDREFAKSIPGYERRFAAVPGITGLAQVRGFRGPIESRAQIRNRVVSDVEYIENRTAIMDLEIVLKSVSIVFARRASRATSLGRREDAQRSI